MMGSRRVVGGGSVAEETANFRNTDEIGILCERYQDV